MSATWYDEVDLPRREDVEALVEYQADGYRAINRSLRGEDARSVDARTIEALDRLLRTLPPTPEPIVVHRGARASDRLRRRLAGSVVRDGGYVSTSLDSDEALGFSTDGGAVYRIAVPAGFPAIWIPGLSRLYDVEVGESEVLLPRGTGLRLGDRDLMWTGTGSVEVIDCEPVLELSSRRSRRPRRSSRARGRG